MLGRKGRGQIVVKTLANVGSFSAVSVPIFASIYALALNVCSVLKRLGFSFHRHPATRMPGSVVQPVLPAQALPPLDGPNASLGKLELGLARTHELGTSLDPLQKCRRVGFYLIRNRKLTNQASNNFRVGQFGAGMKVSDRPDFFGKVRLASAKAGVG